MTISSVALLGGTGRLGRSLAVRFAAAGLAVHVGSRDEGRAIAAASALSQRVQTSDTARGEISGHTNAGASSSADVVFITAPYQGLGELLSGLAGNLRGRLVVSTVVPVHLDADSGPQAIDVPEGSAAELIQHAIPHANVIGGFHTVSSAHLGRAPSRTEDVIFTGDDAEAKQTVAALTRRLGGLRPIDGGNLYYSRFTEGLAVLLLSINALANTRAGIQITEVPD